VQQALFLDQLVQLEFKAMLAQLVLKAMLAQLERLEVSEQLVQQGLKV
jgi:hypothetical protein